MRSTVETLQGGDLRGAVELLGRSSVVAVFSHVNPDGDSIGVGIGLKRGIESLGKQAVFAISDPVPEVLGYLPGIEGILHELPNLPYDLMLVADCGDIDRVGRLYFENEGLFRSTRVLNLDHHDSNTCFGTVNYVDITAASSSELAYRLLSELGADIDATLATALITGIINDTGSFQHSNTDAKVLRIAADLREHGADLERAAFEMFRAKPLSTAKLWGLILSTLNLDAQRSIAWAYMTPEMAGSAGAASDESEGLVDYMSGIREAKVAAFLKEKEPGNVRVSLRSHGIDVSRICGAFNGGGHIRAAGCTIVGTIQEAQEMITRVFDELYALNQSS